jgi:hypothetical protein
MDEYCTDIESFRLLKRWGISKFYKNWWELSNFYNVKIKYFLATGTLYSDLTINLKVSNKKLTKEQILSQISSKTIIKIDKLIKKNKLNITMINYKGV